MHCDSARRRETGIRASDIQRYILGPRSNKWYLCELQSVYMTLCYSLSASCVGGLDLIYISYTLFTGGLYVQFFFWDMHVLGYYSLTEQVWMVILGL